MPNLNKRIHIDSSKFSDSLPRLAFEDNVKKTDSKFRDWQDISDFNTTIEQLFNLCAGSQVHGKSIKVNITIIIFKQTK